MQDDDSTLVWVVTYQGGWIDRPHTSNDAGGRPLSAVLRARDLDALRAMLSHGLQHDHPTTFWPPEVVEMWSAE